MFDGLSPPLTAPLVDLLVHVHELLHWDRSEAWVWRPPRASLLPPLSGVPQISGVTSFLPP